MDHGVYITFTHLAYFGYCLIFHFFPILKLHFVTFCTNKRIWW